MGTKQNAVPSNTIFVYIDVFLHLVILCIDWWLNFASTTKPQERPQQQTYQSTNVSSVDHGLPGPSMPLRMVLLTAKDNTTLVVVVGRD